MNEQTEIKRRLEALREEMRREKLDAYILFGTDPHMSEYVAPRWRDREWMSGFTGSAGTVVVTADAAGLWTDSRYYLQAAKQLEGAEIELLREGIPGVRNLPEWLGEKLGTASAVGASAWTLSLSKQRMLKSELAAYGILFRSTADLLDRIWTGRPPLPSEDIYQHDLKYAGKSRSEKIGEVRSALREYRADYQFISSLSDIAWLFNLRGSDIAFNPLFISYALIGPDEVYLALQRECLSDELASLLEEEQVNLVPYDNVDSLLQDVLEKDDRLVFDPGMVNSALAENIAGICFPVERRDCTSSLKAVKSGVEIRGIRNAMVKDGVAMVQFLHWLSQNWEKGSLTELSIGDTLRQFRSRQSGFIGESFSPIVGFRDHGAVIHYSAEAGSAYRIDQPGLMLIDSGGHYLDGTTDITRTIALGQPTQQQREDYTTVLKGHIQLAAARFPGGTRGFQLDTLAKSPCWERGMQYSHGTGHGVGFFLNVHEGPQSISTRMVDVPIEAGMLCSNEPGVYREGQYGIRIENLILTTELFSTPFGRFYGFETLTLCPLEPALIESRLLGREQLNWVNEYHARVLEALSPHLKQEERLWLEEITAPIQTHA
ncbi:MAG: aminopeptidase P family protein [Sediminispirochaetaceae bacterium]